ncbi:hypothetical protein ACTL6U_16985 [Rhodovibrionaceae bacterium A322]
MIDGLTIFAMLVVVGIGLVHLLSIPLIYRNPRFSGKLSDLMAGVALGYVFLYLLPKISQATERLKLGGTIASIDVLQYRYFILLLIGFVIYYLAIPEPGSAKVERKSRLFFHVTAFSLYNVLVAIAALHLEKTYYLAHLILGALFMLHLFGINFLLLKWHGKSIEIWIRWAFTGSLALGMFMGLVIEPGDQFVMAATALVGGVNMILSTRFKLPSRSVLGRLPFMLGVCIAVVLAYVGIYLDTF